VYFSNPKLETRLPLHAAPSPGAPVCDYASWIGFVSSICATELSH